MARVSRWDLPDQLPSMVDRFGLLLGSGVRTMSKIKRKLEDWLMDNQINGDDGSGFEDYKEVEGEGER